MGLFGRRKQTGSQGHPEPLIVSTSEFIERPVERVWDVVTSTLGATRAPYESLSFFPVPGTPADQVGAVWCCFSPLGGGLVSPGVTTEVVDRQEGSRIATRTWFSDGQRLRTIRLEGGPRGCRVYLATRFDPASGVLDGRVEAVYRQLHRDYYSFVTSLATAPGDPVIFEGRAIRASLEAEFHPSVMVSESVFINRPADQVWQFVHDPASTPLVDDTCEHGFTVPGTPSGQVGEQQCFLHRRGDARYATALEVVELQWGRRAVIVSLTGPFPWRTSTEIEPADGGCVLKLSSQVQVSAEEQASVEASLARLHLQLPQRRQGPHGSRARSSQAQLAARLAVIESLEGEWDCSVAERRRTPATHRP